MYQGVAGGTLTRHVIYRVSRVPASPGLRPQASCGRGRGARARFDWVKDFSNAVRKSQKVRAYANRYRHQ
jgi:hypothetical protein